MGDAHVGLQARLMSQALRKLTATISRTSTSVIFINQLREKVGIVFGNPEVTPGGRALKFYSSIRIDIRPVESIKRGTDVVGRRVKAKDREEQGRGPLPQAEFDIMFETPRGISRSGDIIDLGVEYGILTKSGAFYSFGDLRLGPGPRECASAFLDDNGDLADEIESSIRREVGLVAPTSQEAEGPGGALAALYGRASQSPGRFGNPAGKRVAASGSWNCATVASSCSAMRRANAPG